ncbi:MAG: hypothetical protein JW953_13545 [Anaerolineae bacterium]|nr:hypothetical protein [Anaerolineae bacterium]
MNLSKFNIQGFCLLTTFVLFLTMVGACGIEPEKSLFITDAEQVSDQNREQNVTPTPEISGQRVSPTLVFDTIEIKPEDQLLSDNPAPVEKDNCPGVESMLSQIIHAPDPLSLAEQLQLKMKGNKLQVLLILDREDTSFLEPFAVELGTQVGMQVQAFVPIDQICDLARTDGVVAIRLPVQALPQ